MLPLYNLFLTIEMLHSCYLYITISMINIQMITILFFHQQRFMQLGYNKLNQWREIILHFFRNKKTRVNENTCSSKLSLYWKESCKGASWHHQVKVWLWAVGEDIFYFSTSFPQAPYWNPDVIVYLSSMPISYGR